MKAVCFDLDGVLTDTERLGGKTMNMACSRQGFSLTESQWLNLVGTSSEHTMDMIRSWHPSVDTRLLMQDWTDITFDWVEKRGVPEKKGAGYVLRHLRERGYKTALCTSNAAPVVSRYLSLLSWTDLFDTVVTSEDVSFCKPSPDIYILAASRLGVNPSSCAGIEDSPSGLAAVKAAGMHAVLIPDLIRVPDSCPRDAVLDSIATLPDYLSGLI